MHNLSRSSLRLESKTIQKPSNKASDSFFEVLLPPFSSIDVHTYNALYNLRYLSIFTTSNSDSAVQIKCFSSIFHLMQNIGWFCQVQRAQAPWGSSRVSKILGSEDTRSQIFLLNSQLSEIDTPSN